MNEHIGHAREFRHPPVDIAPPGIVFFVLHDRIEHAEIRHCFNPAAGHTLPVDGVAGDIGINQSFLEPLCSHFLPGHQEILDQKRGDEHPDPVVYLSRAFQLAHAGIDNGKTRFSPGPRGDHCAVIAPWEKREGTLQGLVR